MALERKLSPPHQRPLRPVDDEQLTRAGLLWRVLGLLARFDLGGTEALLEQRVEVVLPRLPRNLDGFCIGFVSDLHIGPTVRATFLTEALARLAALQCDIVVATGDFIVWEAAPLEALVPALEAAIPELGAYFILGNHDYSNPAAVAASLERAGWVHLRDRHLDVVVSEREGAQRVRGDRLLLVGPLTPRLSFFWRPRQCGPAHHQARAGLALALGALLGDRGSARMRGQITFTPS